MKKLIPKFIFRIYHYLLALAGAVLHGFPSKKLVVIGVTGTNGKSTVVDLITRILEGAGYKTASISSIRFKINDKEWQNALKMTMPGRFKLQKFLRQAAKNGCKYAILEVTSEGIKQFRHKFISFDGAIFTNLTKEHIEAHKGFENYRKAKGKLFLALEKSSKKNKFAVLNADDENSEYFSKLFLGKKHFYSIKDFEKNGLQISLFGEFNRYNALAAYYTGLALGIDKNKILEVLKTAKGVPGRLELVIDRPFKVFVDYAHTPDALEKVYKTLGKGLICVLGSCGGGRDKWKRPEMGKIAENYCKEIILTNEDPYNENPSQILSEVESGISNFQFPVFKILDRREAINKALSLAKNNDTVIITGKGCEPWICIANGKKIPWNDRKVVQEELEKVL